MEHQLQDLIDRIKKDGFEAADGEARQKLVKAEEEAARILRDAREEAEAITAKGRKDAERMTASGQDALRQAARDISISVEKDLKETLARLLKEAVAASYQGKVLEEAIQSAVKSWAGSAEGAKIVLPESTGEALGKSVLARLAESGKKGIALGMSPRIKAGFRIQDADGAAYWDFSSDTVADALAEYVNSTLAGIISRKE